MQCAVFSYSRGQLHFQRAVALGDFAALSAKTRPALEVQLYVYQAPWFSGDKDAFRIAICSPQRSAFSSWSRRTSVISCCKSERSTVSSSLNVFCPPSATPLETSPDVTISIGWLAYVSEFFTAGRLNAYTCPLLAMAILISSPRSSCAC